MTDAGHVEPEPIDAEFEPAGEVVAAPQPARRSAAPRRMRGRAVAWPHLIAASSLSAVAGATVAIVVSNAGSNAPTGTLSREIDRLEQQVATLDARARQSGADTSFLRSQLDAHGDRLSQAGDAEAMLRAELAALTSQVNAISGVNGNMPVAEGAAASAFGSSTGPGATPLGVLLARINRLERIVADASSAPETTREVQRAIADLSLQVGELNLANQTLVSAFDRREAALAALETGMQEMAGEVSSLRATGKPAPRITLAAADPLPDPILDATMRAQTIRALSVMDAAARTDSAFAEEHRQLAALMPRDQELAGIAQLAAAGAPTLNSLRAGFDAAAARALRHAGDDSDDGWNWLRQSFSGVVAFEPSRREAETRETLRTARRQLDVGAIRDAVTAVSGLKGRGAEDFAIWRDKALARARLDDALRSLNLRVLGAAAASSGAG
jgi:hypothetical protein